MWTPGEIITLIVVLCVIGVPFVGGTLLLVFIAVRDSMQESAVAQESKHKPSALRQGEWYWSEKKVTKTTTTTAEKEQKDVTTPPKKTTLPN